MASPAQRHLKQPILIAGTGALATLFAARLSAAGYPVTMLGSWKNGLRALRKNGARLVDADGVEHAYPVEVTSNPANCKRARYALVLVKSWQTERVAGQLADCLAEDGLALTLQNGMGNRELLAATLGPATRCPGRDHHWSDFARSRPGAGRRRRRHLGGGASTPGAAGGRSKGSRLQRPGGERCGCAGVGKTGHQRGHQPADGAAARPQWRIVATPGSPQNDECAGTGSSSGCHGAGHPFAL